MMYLPGNNPNMLLRGHLFRPDGLILDLEDSVPQKEKDAARILVQKILSWQDFGSCEVSVRVNGMDTEFWREDLEAVASAAAVNPQVDGIRLPKAESAAMASLLDEALSELEEKHGLKAGHFTIFCLLESAKAVWKAFDIATASSRITGITPGGEDLAADLRTSRSAGESELDWIRRMTLVAGRAAGVDVLDTAYPRIHDLEGLREQTAFVRQLGFDGKNVLHPGQIPIIHEVYTPTRQETENSLRILRAAEEAARKGQGAVAVDGKLVDVPVIKRARYLLSLAGMTPMKDGMESGEEGKRP
jgi:citrate lyase subunit beta/citryl-CoA lyase